MIGWLQGKIIDKQQPGKLVLDVHGVGYDVETSMQTFFQLEEQSNNINPNHANTVNLHIHTIVREDALLLYGFLDKQERSLFRALIKVNGIGPKVAMNILSSVTASEFVNAIRTKNLALLTKLPGIGKKTAERLLIEMKDSILQCLQETTELSFNQEQGIEKTFHEQTEAISALEALGYKAQDAMKAVKKIDDGNKSCEQLIRQALQVLSARV
jgi:Holliday junction DNA helicase RuvA